MSVAGQPGPRRVPGPAWIAGMALLIAVLVVAATVMSTQQPSPLSAVPGPDSAAAPLPRRSPPAAPRRRGDTRGPEPRSAARPKRKQPVQRPVVQIVERRIPIRRSAPVEARPSPPAAVDREARAVPASRPPADVLEPPPPPSEDPVGSPEEVVQPDAPPEPVERREARYPEDAARDDVTGSVRLKVIVDRRGRVEDAIVVRSSGDDRLDSAAEQAVLHWRYRPARQRGRAVTGIDYVTMDFFRDDRQRSEN